MQIIDIPDCGICNGSNDVLGALGSLIHLRCRYCGLDSSITAPENDASLDIDFGDESELDDEILLQAREDASYYYGGDYE